MKKVILFFGLGLVVVLGVAPYGFGRQAEPIFQTFLGQVEAALQLPVRTTHYSRGWFRSTAETVLDLPAGAVEAIRLVVPQATSVAGRPVVLTMTHQLFHGPFPLVMILHGQVPLTPIQLHIETGMLLEAGTVSGTSSSPVRISTTIALAGGGWSDLALPAGQANAGPQEHAMLSWQKLQGHITFAAHGQRFTGTLGTAALTGEGRQGAITAHDLLLQVEANADEQQRYQGMLMVQGKTLALVSHENRQQDITLHGWGMQNTATIAGEILNVTTAAHVKTIQTATTLYGPATGTLEMRRLHTMSLLTLARTFLPLLQPEAARHSPGFMPFGSLFTALPAFAKQAPEVELTQVSLQTSAGEVRGKAKMAFDANKTPGLLTLLRPLNTLAGQGEIATPVALLQQMLTPASREQLQQLEQQGYVVRDGEQYVFSARFARGQLLVNNKPVALSLFGG